MKHSSIATAASLFVSIIAASGCSGESAGGGASAPGEAPTYTRDIAPLVEAKCGNCHVEGGIAPFALSTIDDLRMMAPAVKASVAGKTMPPWPASDNCNNYLYDRSLSDDQIATIVRWVDDGMPEGDPSATPDVVEGLKGGLSRVDIEMALPVAYTPIEAPDEYRCFIIDWPEAETTYVTGFNVVPGYAPIVHHAIAFLAKPESVADYQALDEAEPGPGYKCFGGPGGKAAGGAGWLGGWAPGGLGYDYPAGTGIEVPAGSKVILQMHYNTSTAAAAPDQTKIDFRIDKSVEKRGAVLPFTNISWIQNQTMTIPAHTSDVVHATAADPTGFFVGVATGGALPTNTPLTIYQAGLHMHTRGTQAVTRIERADGSSECMLEIPKWNFHWQGSYFLEKPTVFNPGDKLSLECHWNNPGDKALNWGEGTDDEMCLGVFYMSE